MEFSAATCHYCPPFSSKVLKNVPWYTERSLTEISLGSLLILVVIRTIQFNMTRTRVKQTQCKHISRGDFIQIKSVNCKLVRCCVVCLLLRISTYTPTVSLHSPTCPPSFEVSISTLLSASSGKCILSVKNDKEM